MSLSEVLRRHAPYQPRPLSGLAPLAAAAERVLARWPDAVKEPPEKDRERLVQEMLRRLEQEDWRDVHTSFVTTAAVALFDNERRERPDLAKLRQFYLDEIIANDSASFRRAMVAVYIGSYVPRAAHTVALARSLSRVADALGGRWSVLLQAVPRLLDGVSAHEQVSQLMLSMPQPWSNLKSINLRSPHAPGLMTHAHLAFVKALAPDLAEPPAIDKLLNWLKPEGAQPKAEGASEAISALLMPWRTSDPPSDLRSELTTRITGLYGDPRTRGKEAPWNGVADDLVEHLSRWLTGENIRFFMDIVSDVETSHMWTPRRQFWMKLHQERRITSAWVALSDEGARLARQRAAGRPGLKFGRQIAGGSRIRTCLLILKIGSKIVVEGSHNYKVHVFDESAAGRPKLYQDGYDCELIRSIRGAQAKMHLGDWQGWVRERI
ncbi:hypothetical protein C3941_01995 [Kaistia algarum]|uniref:EH signature domain-containing protein n=1 Tax=Kaistia algarum TaxID=2083279 RepID=UPI000CE84544|nr:EH signature domain-containing protein [Kaistia algarum]MCX5513010.1 EH signature domain-containing protein [Kaistia algarum]PPE81507.1 hypothetical protein C3941_01995 [Kaistia algarum]